MGNAFINKKQMISKGHKKNIAVLKKRRSPFIFFLFILLPLFLYPSYLNAQSGSLPYIDSITSDEHEGTLSMPFFVKAEPEMNEIYVIDTRGRVIIYTSDFFPLYTLNKKYGIETPQGLAVDKQGNLYVAQAPSKKNPQPRISIFSSCLMWSRDIVLRGFEGAESFSPRRVAIDRKGDLYVASGSYPGVIILNNSGTFQQILTPEEDGVRVKINNVTIDRSGNIYLVSEQESHIYVYSEDREFLFTFGEKGGSPGKLSRPRAVAAHMDIGELYVVDYMRHAILVYDKKGSFLFEFGGLGWGPGWFQHPIDIDIDDKGRIMIADFFNHRVQVFSAK